MVNDKPKLDSDSTSNIVLPQRSLWQRLLALGLIVLLLLIGFIISRYLLKTRPQAKRKAPKRMEALVKVVKVMPTAENMRIEAPGRVVAARQITLKARVSGQVIYIHPDFIPGGVIKKGEVLLQLDDTDYQLELRRKEDALALAEADLRIEEGSQMVALKEWELITSLSDDIDTSSRDLALRKPHLIKAKAKIASAKTALERARVDLARTVIKAPFNLVVRAENVDLGLQVTPVSTLATLAATDIFWAEISLPVTKLAWFDMPEKQGKGKSGKSKTIVLLHILNQPSLTGKIITLTPDLDKDGLMARLLVAITDPLGLQKKHPPVLLGSFVTAEIIGRKLQNVYRIPRAALKENDLLLIADKDDRLVAKPVTVAYYGVNSVLVDSGLNPGDRLIISNLAAPINGMALKIAEPVNKTAANVSDPALLPKPDKKQKAAADSGRGRQ